MQIDLLIRKYYLLIKEKARVYSEQNSCFHRKKIELASYFKECDVGKILNEVESIQHLSNLIFEVLLMKFISFLYLLLVGQN